MHAFARRNAMEPKSENKVRGRARPRETQDLSAGKGRSDEVDASRGIFPPGAPHPEGAEVRMPGSLGGGPYQESGRSGLHMTGEAEEVDAEAEGAEDAGMKEGEELEAEAIDTGESEQEEEHPPGILPPHRPSRSSAPPRPSRPSAAPP
jgi:hypothetical protein